MRRARLRLLAAGAIPALALLADRLLEPGLVRFALLALTFFVAPGYCIQAALFSRVPTQAGPFERAGLSVALSVALTGILATVLNFSAFGVSLAPLLAMLAATSLGAVALASVDAPGRAAAREANVPRPAVFAAAAALVIAGAGVLAAAPPASDRSQLPFTEFYVVGDDGRLGSHPQSVPAGATARLNVTAVSHERERAEFTVVLSVDAEIVQTWRFTLEHGERWSERIPVAPGEPGQHDVRLVLLKDGQGYRRLELPIEVRP